jgi:hypothetical protein
MALDNGNPSPVNEQTVDPGELVVGILARHLYPLRKHETVALVGVQLMAFLPSLFRGKM